MYKSITPGLVQYQQTVGQTPGIAPSAWYQSTNPQPPLLIQFIPTQIEKRDEKLYPTITPIIPTVAKKESPAPKKKGATGL